MLRDSRNCLFMVERVERQLLGFICVPKAGSVLTHVHYLSYFPADTSIKILSTAKSSPFQQIATVWTKQSPWESFYQQSPFSLPLPFTNPNCSPFGRPSPLLYPSPFVPCFYHTPFPFFPTYSFLFASFPLPPTRLLSSPILPISLTPTHPILFYYSSLPIHPFIFINQPCSTHSFPFHLASPLFYPLLFTTHSIFSTYLLLFTLSTLTHTHSRFITHSLLLIRSALTHTLFP